MHVAHFKASAFTRQTARAQSGNTTLVRNFRQWVGLVHELTQLAGAEEFANSGRNRLAIDQILRRQIVRLGLGQTFADSAFNTHQAGAELIFRQFTDATNTTIAQMIDIVNFTATIAQFHQNLNRVNDIFIRERAGTFRIFATKTGVNLHAANTRQIVRFIGEEQTIHQRFNSFFCRRFARTHHAVNGHTSGHLIRRFIDTQGIGNKAALIQLIGVNRLEALDLGFAQFR